jgi:probable biosynthetic protein (TIGR04098 family)
MSENWLLKGLGSLYWDRLCAALGSNSQSLAHGEGRRHYAISVRISLDLEKTLAAFQERDQLAMSISMSRFGRCALPSTIKLEGSRRRG